MPVRYSHSALITFIAAINQFLESDNRPILGLKGSLLYDQIMAVTLCHNGQSYHILGREGCTFSDIWRFLGLIL